MTIGLRHILVFLLLAGLVGLACYLADELDATRLKLTGTQEQLSTANEELEAAREAARKTAVMLDARNQVDNERTEALNHARTKNRALQLDVNQLNKRLLVKATCVVPNAADSGAASLADAGTAELSADARPDYFTLRDELALTREMILGQQDYIRRVVFGTSATEKTLKRMEVTQ
ncbi:Bacteriophage lysis protein [Pseudomonas cichorii]|uniref:Bacteriophage lysis protein n=1 Tax=Pseudomonas cichorii TaxID=36746 RepID=A0A3M4M4N6_PSECI|nr:MULTISPECIES: lysis system i-spanin subunit Rz [Pseudomonas]RMQ48772.1 Bacteriophage lysis protein [Pseudomonas cichorii]